LGKAYTYLSLQNAIIYKLDDDVISG